MNVRTASDLIDRAYASGQIDLATANRAQNAIRSRDYYGSRMTGEDRRRIVNVRFGIVAAADNCESDLSAGGAA